MDAKQYIQQNQGKFIVSIMIDESDLYSLMKDGSWARHEWHYDVEFNPDKIPESMVFNSINDAVSYIKQQNNFPSIENADSYQFFANQVPTIEQMDNIFSEGYTFVEVMEVMTGAFYTEVGELATDITNQVLA